MAGSPHNKRTAASATGLAKHPPGHRHTPVQTQLEECSMPRQACSPIAAQQQQQRVNSEGTATLAQHNTQLTRYGHLQ